MESTKKDLLSGGREREREMLQVSHTCAQGEPSREAALTCGHGAHQYGVELDDGAEGMFGVRGARQVFAVTFKDETLILFL